MLYNSDLVHYDLLAERDSPLVNLGPVSSRLENILFGNVSKEFSFNIDIGAFDFENIQLSQIETPRPLHNRLITGSYISPMVFPPCPRGRGRPKKKREGGPNLNAKEKRTFMDGEDDLVPPPKKKGRPPGSRNKEKDSLRSRAEQAVWKVVQFCG